jgi:ribonuclease P protein component
VAKAISDEFPRAVRIVCRSDYQKLYKTGRRISSERFVMFSRENVSGRSRLGITVSRKVGSAVIRNRVKRLFREIFRKSYGQIPGRIDIVVNAKPGCAEVGYEELRVEFLAAVRRACL